MMTLICRMFVQVKYLEDNDYSSAGAVAAVSIIVRLLFYSSQIIHHMLTPSDRCQHLESSCHERAAGHGCTSPPLHFNRIPCLLRSIAMHNRLSPPLRRSYTICQGVTSTVGRIGFGRLADRSPTWRTRIFQSAFLATGASTALLASSASQFLVYPVCMVFGTFAGAFIALMPGVMADHVPLDELPPALGLGYSVQCLPVLLGPPAAGWIIESSDAYWGAWLLSGLTMGAAFVASLMIIPPPTTRNSPDTQTGKPSPQADKSAVGTELMVRAGEEAV